jgi:hypothetical protein
VGPARHGSLRVSGGVACWFEARPACMRIAQRPRTLPSWQGASAYTAASKWATCRAEGPPHGMASSSCRCAAHAPRKGAAPSRASLPRSAHQRTASRLLTCARCAAAGGDATGGGGAAKGGGGGGGGSGGGGSGGDGSGSSDAPHPMRLPTFVYAAILAGGCPHRHRP